MRSLGFSLEQVRTFIAVASAQNMSRAASAVNLTQGAVTQQMHHFERALGIQLVERTRHGIRLTPAGSAVAQACLTAARELESIEEAARLYRTMEIGALRIGAGPTCAGHYLPPLLARFVQEFPQVEVAVTVGNSPSIAEQVASGQLDCGLIEGPAADPKLEERLLLQDELVVVAGSGHPLARSKHVTLADLAPHRYLSREPGSALEHSAREMLGDAYDQSPHLVLNQLDAVQAAALSGLGYAVLPLVAVLRELKDRTLVRLPVASKSRWIRAVRRAASRVPAVDEFWRFLPVATEVVGADSEPV
jgi:DNA-binding transcriptional LysR family regulator